MPQHRDRDAERDRELGEPQRQRGQPGSLLAEDGRDPRTSTTPNANNDLGINSDLLM
jgi:hypothetical protein